LQILKFEEFLKILSPFFLLWRCDPKRAMASSFLRFLDHTQRRTIVGRTLLDVWSARRRDLYLTAHNNHNRQTSMPSVGFEPTISAGERPQTYALERAATVTGLIIILIILYAYTATCFYNHMIIFSLFTYIKTKGTFANVILWG